MAGGLKWILFGKLALVFFLLCNITSAKVDDYDDDSDEATSKPRKAKAETTKRYVEDSSEEDEVTTPAPKKGQKKPTKNKKANENQQKPYHVTEGKSKQSKKNFTSITGSFSSSDRNESSWKKVDFLDNAPAAAPQGDESPVQQAIDMFKSLIMPPSS